MQPRDVDWDRIDKTKFFVIGVGAFSGVTTLLYPLTVIKTNQQLAHGPQTTAQTTRMIWKSRGMAGFYRGYATVIFGTIPARVVYMTCLEVVKSAVTKAGHKLEFSDTAVAGAANFLAGGTSSLVTQLITVPIDVVSQRQMAFNTGSAVKAAADSLKHAPAASSAATSARPLSTPTPGLPSTGPGTPPVGFDRPAGPSSASSSVQCSSSARSLHSAALLPKTDAALLQRLRSTPVSSSSSWAPAGSGAALLAGARRGLVGSVPSHSQAQAASASASGPQLPSHTARSVIRNILREEGIVGLYRGLGASVATFVPSSAVWWGSYGVYQKMIWRGLHLVSGGASPSSTAASTAAAGAAAVTASTTNVVLVQTTSSCLAGCTSAFVTAPLDLIKTRIQVARKTEGQATTFRAVAAEVLREDGWLGMFRAAGPRMASSALWGTAMVSVYEMLKRVSVKD